MEFQTNLKPNLKSKPGNPNLETRIYRVLKLFFPRKSLIIELYETN